MHVIKLEKGVSQLSKLDYEIVVGSPKLVILSGMEVHDRCHDLSDVEIDALSSWDELEHGEEEEDEQGVAIAQGATAVIARKRSLQRTSLSKSSTGSKRTCIAHVSAMKLKSVTADQ